MELKNMNSSMPDWLIKRLKRCPEERIAYRRDNEDKLRKILDEKAGRLTQQEWKDFLNLLDSDFYDGKKKGGRFGQSFRGNNFNLVTDEFEKLNEQTAELWNANRNDKIDVFRKLWDQWPKGAGPIFKSAVLYLQFPGEYNICANKMFEFCRTLGMETAGRSEYDRYLEYNDFINAYKKKYNLQPESIDIVFSTDKSILSDTEEIQDENKQSDKENIMSSSLNTILYGPPGTGKTYNVVNQALQTLNQEPPKDRDEAVKLFNEYKQNGQISFITFHQSYSYEEFVEGLKPVTTENVDENDLGYKIESGIFKRISQLAKKDKSNFNEMIDSLKNECSEAEEMEPINIKAKNSSFTITYRDGRTFRVKPEKSLRPDKDYPASIENIQKVYENPESDSEVYNPTYVRGILDYLYDKGLVPFEKADTDLKKPYILIIDEINRGNISKIFGELITLIEEDKRLGAENELTVTLPYSKETFGVPSNLYIIGTMNTADRSIALMDTALRRRFTFEEMMPEPGLLKNEIEGINLGQLLEAINLRIEYLYDRDHTIGHAYLINTKTIEDLKDVFQNRIIPLLQEYFYNDWEKIILVLNDQNKKEEYRFIKQINGNTSDSKYVKQIFGSKGQNLLDEYDEKKIFRLNTKAFDNSESYRQIIKAETSEQTADESIKDSELAN